MILIEFTFWLSILLICYSYIGYPFLLWAVAIIHTNKPNITHKTVKPHISLLISAYNEEENIEEKIRNSIELNYPSDLIEIIVISDGSEDKTDAIVGKYANRGVLLHHYDGRIGKTACLNKTIPLTKGDIIIFSDANSLYDKDAASRLISKFEDKNTGFVSGHTKYIITDSESDLASIGIYAKIEVLTKKLETKIGSCVGADGAMFAIRKELYKPLKGYDINDFVIPLNIIEQGFKGVFEEKAFCFEKTARDKKGEFNRQVRITNRTLRAIFTHKQLLNPLKYCIFSFQLISHKLLKFCVPFIMVLAFVLNLLLTISLQYDIYYLSLAVQILFYLMGWAGSNMTNIDILSKTGSLCRSFIMVNIAIILGWIRFIQGETYTTWNPNR